MPTTESATITKTITDLLSHLVRMPTVTSNAATNRAALDWVEEQLAGLPLRVKRYEQNGHPSLVATTRQSTKQPRLWLCGHLDVVHGSPAMFKPRIENGRLHGRGVHDMKFAIAVFIAVLQQFGPRLRGFDLGLMITTDEEIGGYDGVKWLLGQRGYRGDAAIMPDSGGSWEIEMGSKGIMWWELTATGRSAHASRPWEGDNAIDKIMRFVAHVRGHLEPEPCGDPGHQHTTINFASLNAGSATNQVPDAATARLDIRFTPNLSISDITAWMEQAAVAVPGVEAKVVLADPPYLVKQNGAVALFEHLTQEITGHGLKPAVAHGSSDARHFARHDIPTVNVSITGSGFHVPDEWIDIDDLGRYYDIIRRFIEEWCK
jgi:succinyl-diaminopimelate desuccinylase